MAGKAGHIPWALDLKTGRWISADRAEAKPLRGRYRCPDPGCLSDLTVARSKRGRRHFKHFRGSMPGSCVWGCRQKGGNAHEQAQALLKAVLVAGLQKTAPMPYLKFCTPQGVVTALMFIPGKTVATEWTCPASGRRADLAILDTEGKPLLLIEIFHTHAVDGMKRLDLRRHWWIEVEAGEVLANPHCLVIKSSGNLPEELRVLGEQGELFSDAAFR